MSTNALEELADAEALIASRAAWRRTVEAELKGAPFDKKLITRTAEGIALQPLYTRAETEERNINLDTVVRPTARVFGGWEVAQEIAAATPEEFNRRLREDLMGGQDAAVLVAASPARPDGLALDEAWALDAAFAGVDLGAITVHLDAGADAGVLATRYFKVAAMQGRGSETLRGSLTADPLAAWAVKGALPTNLKEALDALAAWTARAASAAHELRTVGVDARMWAEAGGTAVHELAFALA
ncbi:MAG: methylmalonyl-CoA mutase, partial [Burkholderiales bacterium]|nr:methylmalonyl-CoA mutase [Opitutaceae bacterium]